MTYRKLYGIIHCIIYEKYVNIVCHSDRDRQGYAIGFALKKILKWMLIILGFLADQDLVSYGTGNFDIGSILFFRS